MTGQSDSESGLLSEIDENYFDDKSSFEGVDREREKRLIREYMEVLLDFSTVFDYVEQDILKETVSEFAEREDVIDNLDASIAFLYMIAKKGTADQIQLFEDGALIAENIDTVFNENVEIFISMNLQRTYREVEFEDVIEQFYSGDVFEFVELLLHQGFARIGEHGMRDNIITVQLEDDFPGSAYDLEKHIDKRGSFNEEKDVVFNPTSPKDIELIFEDRT